MLKKRKPDAEPGPADGGPGARDEADKEEDVSEGEEVEPSALDDKTVHVVSFSLGTDCGAVDAAEATMMIKAMLAPTHSKAAFSVLTVRTGGDVLEGRVYLGSAAAAARAVQLDGVVLRAAPKKVAAWARASTSTVGAVCDEVECADVVSAATTLGGRDLRGSAARAGRAFSLKGVAIYATDESKAAAIATWRLIECAVARQRVGPDEDRAEAARAALRAHNAAHAPPEWDARPPLKFDSKVERWKRADAPSSPPSLLDHREMTPPPTRGEAGEEQEQLEERVAWTVRRRIKRSTWLALHRRRVEERSLRVEDVVEHVVDADGSRWTLSLDARRRDGESGGGGGAATHPAAPDAVVPGGLGAAAAPGDASGSSAEASDLGVYAKCEFGGPLDGATRPFGACCETRFAFCVVEDLAGVALDAEKDDDDDAADGGEAAEDKADAALSSRVVDLQGCGSSRAASWLFRGRELYDDQTVPALPARGFARLVLGNKTEDAEATAGVDGTRWFASRDGDEPSLVVCAAVLVTRRLKGVDTWRLVRRCCAERASGYSSETLNPRNVFNFLCRAVRWGDVECAKALARQIQYESDGDTAHILRATPEVGWDDPAGGAGGGAAAAEAACTPPGTTTTGAAAGKAAATAAATAHKPTSSSSSSSSSGSHSSSWSSSSTAQASNEYSVLHWLGNCDDALGLSQADVVLEAAYPQIVAWLRSVCGAEAFETELNGSVVHAPKHALTPLAFVCSCAPAARASSRRAVQTLLKAGADPTREVADEPPLEEERGTFPLARALYAENLSIASELLHALFSNYAPGANNNNNNNNNNNGNGAAASSASYYFASVDGARERRVVAVVADAVDVLLSKADEAVVAAGIECMLGAGPAAREATLAALRKRHADAVGRDADRSPVHELVACALRMETNPSSKQRERADLAAVIEATLALAHRLVRQERLALRHARGGERVRLYLEAYVRRQAKLAADQQQQQQQQHPAAAHGKKQHPDGAAAADDDAWELDPDLLDDGDLVGDKTQRASSKKKKRAKRKAKKQQAAAPAAARAPATDDSAAGTTTAPAAATAAATTTTTTTTERARREDSSDDSTDEEEDPHSDDGSADVNNGDSRTTSTETTPSVSPLQFAADAPRLPAISALRSSSFSSSAALEKREPTQVEAADRLRDLVSKEADLTEAELDDLTVCRELTRGLEGLKRDRAAAKKLKKRLRPEPAADAASSEGTTTEPAAEPAAASDGASEERPGDAAAAAATTSPASAEPGHQVVAESPDNNNSTRTTTTVKGGLPPLPRPPLARSKSANQRATGYLFVVPTRDMTLSDRGFEYEVSGAPLADLRTTVGRDTALFAFVADDRSIHGPLKLRKMPRRSRDVDEDVVVAFDDDDNAGEAHVPQAILSKHGPVFDHGGELDAEPTRDLERLLQQPRVVTPPGSSCSSVDAPGSPARDATAVSPLTPEPDARETQPRVAPTPSPTTPAEEQQPSTRPRSASDADADADAAPPTSTSPTPGAIGQAQLPTPQLGAVYRTGWSWQPILPWH